MHKGWREAETESCPGSGKQRCKAPTGGTGQEEAAE